MKSNRILIDEFPLTPSYGINKSFFNLKDLDHKLFNLVSPLIEKENKLIKGNADAGRVMVSPTSFAIHIAASEGVPVAFGVYAQFDNLPILGTANVGVILSEAVELGLQLSIAKVLLIFH